MDYSLKLSEVSSKWLIFFQLKISDGVEQQHLLRNAFNVLSNEGFLRDKQGVLTLEVVQIFYRIINEQPRNATLVVEDLNNFRGKHTLSPKPVITLVKEDSETKEAYFHAVRVSKIQIFPLTCSSGHSTYSHIGGNGLDIERTLVNYN